VCDLDDPVFSVEEISALNLPNVAAVVTTTELVRRNLQAAGVRSPIEVIPQGVAIRRVDPDRVRAIRRQYSPDPDEVIVGLHQPHFDFASELPVGSVEQMYAVDNLLDAMMRAREEKPRLILWLVGRPSPKVGAFAADHGWVRLIGYHPRAGLMEYVSVFNIGVYPRILDLKGRSSVKVLEYMACGVPIIGFQVKEMRIASEGEAGIAVPDIASFAEALKLLTGNRAQREQMGANGKRTARRYDWDILSEAYRNLMDRLSEPVPGKEGVSG
ncbi:MAG TPA: glycosyltransferase family 4 protein, partial [Anaerolineales bacterium]